jgi:2-polyprenyl-3-methyl-5-hydroxy-6-metoxy-1,4-benzoquinol methylase
MVYLAQEITYAQQAAEHEFADSYLREHARRQQKHPLLLAISGITRKLKPEIGDRLLAQTLRWWPASRDGRLLDLGCGDGKFLEKAARHFEVTGVEISERLAQLAEARVPSARILRAPIAEAALPEAHFDVVTQFSVLEHEWHPLDALRATHRALSPGGITVIKVPNHASWNRHIMRHDWCGYRLPDHCNYFTPRTLATMLRKAGFTPLPGSLLDRLPTSDSLWLGARKL